MFTVLKFSNLKLSHSHMQEIKQLTREKDFKEGVEAFESRKCGTQNAGRSPDFYRGWAWAWGCSDGLQGSQCIFPGDPDYADGYSIGITERMGSAPILSSVFTAKAF